MFGDAHKTCATRTPTRNDHSGWPPELPPSDSESDSESPLPSLFPSQPTTSSINFNDASDPFRLEVNDSNLDFGVTASEDSESDPYASDRKPILDESVRPCSGQPVEWTPGSVWDSYAYQMHDDDSLPWNLIGFQEGNFIIIQSRDDCTGSLFSDKERDRGSCNACFSLLNSDDLRRFISRAHQSEAKSHTPWKYLNRQQLAHLLVKSRRKVQDLHLKVCPIYLI
jgi:hypothetical protein